MIIKIIGAILIVCATTKIGFDYAKTLKKRRCELKDFELALSILENEISFKGSSLDIALEVASRVEDKNIQSIFKNAAEKIRNNCLAQEAISEAIEEVKGITAFKSEDIFDLKRFGELLGNSDISGQISNLKEAQLLLHNKIEQAKDEEDKYSKLYKVSGCLIGIAIVLVLF